MSKLRKTKQELDKEYEELEAVGAPGKKGVAAAKEVFKREEKKVAEEQKLKEEQLARQLKNKRRYIDFLADMLKRGLNEIIWPIGWIHRVGSTDKGVVMEIETNDHHLYRIAFKACGVPGFDMNAVNNYIERAYGLIDKYYPVKKATRGNIQA